VGEIERWRTEVSNLDVVWESVFGFEKANHKWADGIIAKQHISDSADEDSLAHRIFATAIFQPDASNA